MKTLTIGQRMVVGFCLLTAIGLIPGMFSYRLLLPIAAPAHFMATDAMPGVTSILEIDTRAQLNAALVQTYLFAPPDEKAAIASSIQRNADKVSRESAAYEKSHHDRRGSRREGA